MNFIDVITVKSKLKGGSSNKGDSKVLSTDMWDFEANDLTLDDLLERQPDLKKLKTSPDLPDQLALMDVQSLLPKLPALPSLPVANPHMIRSKQNDEGSDIFSSQASLDAAVHATHLKNPNAVDVLLICDRQGTVQPVLYDSLSIGTVNKPLDLDTLTPLLHSSHPYTCTHMLLAEADAGSADGRLALIPLSLRFIQSSGTSLHLIASKTAQLQNLLYYVQGCIKLINAYWLQTQDLPSKFMRNINDTLVEHGEGTLVQSLYHVAVTGHCSAALKEWLVDELTERVRITPSIREGSSAYWK